MFAFHIHRVEGTSMVPTYRDGDYVLSFSLGRWSHYQCGDVVLVDHATFGRIIKRIYKISTAGIFSMHGDSDDSSSPEALGIARIESIIGKVFYSTTETNQ